MRKLAAFLLVIACAACGHGTQTTSATPTPTALATSQVALESPTPLVSPQSESPSPESSTNSAAPSGPGPTPSPEWTPTGSGVQTSIPMQAGLTIVTAGESEDGDLESIKQVTSADSRGITLAFDSKTPISTVDTTRRTSAKDLDHSYSFFQDFCNGSPMKYRASDETPVQGDHPGTTTLELSRDLLATLNSQGAATMTFYMSAMCMAMSSKAQVHKVGEGGVPIILDDKPVAVTAIHIQGGEHDCVLIPAAIRFNCYDMWILDDPNDPLVLRFILQDEEMRVIKISQPGPQMLHGLADTLAANKSAAVYGIYFDFNQATIRPQSKPALAAIAQLLAQHPQWKLEIDGHTDSIGSAAYNLALSRRRAESVKAALVSTYQVSAARLTTGGFGATHPVATNATLEGRALNRRVELTRQ